MKTRAKFEVTKVSEFGGNGKRHDLTETVEAGKPDSKGVTTHHHRNISIGVPVREVTLTAVYGGSTENDSFATATPSGTITFQLNNPALAEEFKPGSAYYVEFIPVEAGS